MLWRNDSTNLQYYMHIWHHSYNSLYLLLLMKNSVHTDFHDSKHYTTSICSLQWHGSFNSVLIDGIYYGWRSGFAVIQFKMLHYVYEQD